MMRHMPAIPEPTRSSIIVRLLDHAGKNWPQLAKVRARYHGSFAYITGVLRNGEQIPLFRLRYGGSAHSFGFAIYSAASDRFEDAVLLTGSPVGTPQEALDTACTVHLAGLGHEPPANLRGHPLKVHAGIRAGVEEDEHAPPRHPLCVSLGQQVLDLQDVGLTVDVHPVVHTPVAVACQPDHRRISGIFGARGRSPGRWHVIVGVVISRRHRAIPRSSFWLFYYPAARSNSTDNKSESAGWDEAADPGLRRAIIQQGSAGLCVRGGKPCKRCIRPVPESAQLESCNCYQPWSTIGDDGLRRRSSNLISERSATRQRLPRFTEPGFTLCMVDVGARSFRREGVEFAGQDGVPYPVRADLLGFHPGQVLAESLPLMVVPPGGNRRAVRVPQQAIAGVQAAPAFCVREKVGHQCR